MHAFYGKGFELLTSSIWNQIKEYWSSHGNPLVTYGFFLMALSCFILSQLGERERERERESKREEGEREEEELTVVVPALLEPWPGYCNTNQSLEAMYAVHTYIQMSHYILVSKTNPHDAQGSRLYCC